MGDPARTIQEVGDGADRLEQAAERLYEVTLRFEKAEEAWDRLRLREIANIYHTAKRAGEKLPGEDVRNALVMELHYDSTEYLDYVAAKAEAAALDKRYRALAAAVSARQSLLRVLQGVGA